MFSSNLLLALAFSALGVRVQATSSATCTFYLQTENAVPADPATSVNTGELRSFGRAFYLMYCAYFVCSFAAIAGSVSSGLRTSDATVSL